MNKKQILYVLLEQYAAHEMVFLSQAINDGEMGPRENPIYINKVVSKSLEPVTSIGGVRTLPDYTFDNVPKDYAALILIGGHSWLTPEADCVLPLVKDALSRGVIVGAICNAASWMAKQGFLNEVKHTGNGLSLLQYWGGANYTNAANYVNEQAVSDGNIVTANGSGQLEFARELLLLLENDTPEMIERYYMFNKLGLVKLFSPRPRFACNTVGFLTKDNKAIVDFYIQAFGFTTNWDGEQPNVEMQLGDMRIILFPRDLFEQMTSQKYEYVEGFNAASELAMDVPTFADVDKEYTNAIACGGKSVLPPTTEPWGQRTCYVADPDGNLIEIGSFCEG